MKWVIPINSNDNYCFPVCFHMWSRGREASARGPGSRRALFRGIYGHATHILGILILGMQYFWDCNSGEALQVMSRGFSSVGEIPRISMGTRKGALVLRIYVWEEVFLKFLFQGQKASGIACVCRWRFCPGDSNMDPLSTEPDFFFTRRVAERHIPLLE